MSCITPSRRWLSITALVAAAACKVYDPSLTDEVAAGGSASASGGAAGGGASGGGSNAGSGGSSSGASSSSGGSGGSGGDVSQGGTSTRPDDDGGQAGEPAGGQAAEPVGGAGGVAGEDATGGEGDAGAPPVIDPGINIIDDFEDVNLTLANHDGRGGVWFFFQGGTTILIDAPERLTGTRPAALGAYALHGGRAANASVGTGLGADLKSGRTAYDASRYTGVKLWAKATGSTRIFTIQMADVNSDPNGMVCNAASNAPNEQKCNNHFGKAQEFSTQWAQYSFPFSSMMQAAGWGLQKPAIDKSKLFGFQVVGEPNTAIDLWIDQVEFY